MKIKHILGTLLSVMLIPFCLTSCFDDKEETEQAGEYCYIARFTLGTVKRDLHTLDVAGKDSVYTTTYSGGTFGMSVNQRTLIIENADSLPYGSRVGAVKTEVDFSGVLLYKQADDEEWHTYSNNDSINFSKPVQFRVHSPSGRSERSYTVKVNVHQVDGDKFNWQRFDGGTNDEALADIKECRIAKVGQNVWLLGRKSDGDVVCGVHAASLPSRWSLDEPKGADLSDADISTMCTYQDNMLVGNAKGEILCSQNGQNWDVLTAAVPGRRLLGASKLFIYALTDGTVECSSDGGQTWHADRMDDEASLIPDNNVSVTFMEQDNGYQRLLLVGNRTSQSDLRAEVWSKAWRVKENQNGIGEASAEWMYYPHTADNQVMLSQMVPLFVLPYSKGVVALGGKTLDGRYKALQSMFFSPDCGLTWRASTDFLIPETLHGTTGPIAVTVDQDSFIWIVAAKQLWRGRLNRLGFERD